MKVIFTKLAAALLYLWQLPQNLLGLLLLRIYGRVLPIDFRGDGWRDRLPSSMIYFIEGFHGGISLGRYILMSGYYATASDVWYHERGHSIQSMILGPLYLFGIGLRRDETGHLGKHVAAIVAEQLLLRPLALL